MYHIGQLVHALATVVGVHVHILCAKVAPLKAIDRTQIPLLPMLEPNAVQEGSTAVPVPDPHILLLQLLGRGRAPDEPEQFLGDPTVEDLLGGDQVSRGKVPSRSENLI